MVVSELSTNVQCVQGSSKTSAQLPFLAVISIAILLLGHGQVFYSCINARRARATAFP